ncbi:hypothetical protein CAEBREN_01545 [Caenorhabditis brenneri]|uniref:Uncharacterized protein n=1 Tax=Caenorhabditis brenneri TaxID=135651 RepID=G0MW53_CAEBE|nr:hypothetical protein CAEBREN_01545 [Caenorhabditis brenneri]
MEGSPFIQALSNDVKERRKIVMMSTFFLIMEIVVYTALLIVHAFMAPFSIWSTFVYDSYYCLSILSKIAMLFIYISSQILLSQQEDGYIHYGYQFFKFTFQFQVAIALLDFCIFGGLLTLYGLLRLPGIRYIIKHIIKPYFIVIVAIREAKRKLAEENLRYRGL